MLSVNITPTNKKLMLLLIALISVVIALVGFWFYNHETSKLTVQKQKTLSAISYLKAEQIKNWYNDELNNINLISQNPSIIEKIENFIQAPIQSTLNNLTDLLKHTIKEHGYAELMITNPTGEIITSSSNTKEPNSFELKALDLALKNKQSVSSDLFKSVVNQQESIYISFLSPIKDYSNKVIAIIIGRINPYDFLFPIIESWPTPSQTAESFIFKIENDSIIYLNNLRHKNNTALNLKIPIAKSDLLASKTAQGLTGIIDGKDYRDVEVNGYSSKIKDTPWFLISKINNSELFEEVPMMIGGIVLLVILAIFSSVFVIGYIYNQKQKVIYKDLYNKEKELWQQQEKFKVTLDSLGEGIIVTDMNAKIQYMNNIAEQLTEWRLREAKGRLLGEVYSVRNEETGQKENNILEKVIKHGIVKELANHTILISKNGKEIPVMDTGAPVLDIDGSLNGIVITFVDETERRNHERLLKERDEFIISILSSLSEHIAVIDNTGKIIAVNLAWEQFALQNGVTTLERVSVGTNYFDVCDKAIEKGDEIASTALNGIKSVLNGEENFFEMEYPCHSPEIDRWFVLRVNPFVGDKEKIVISHENITERKISELMVSELKERLEFALETSHTGAWDLDLIDHTAYRSLEHDKIFGYSELLPEWTYEMFLEHVLPEDRAKVNEKFIAAIENKSDWNFDCRIRRADGEVRWIWAAGRHKVDKSGMPLRMAGIVLDITELKIAEDSLREKSTILEAYFENTLTLNVILDKEFNFIRVNNAYANAAGYDADFFVGKNYFERYPSDVKKIFEDVVKTKTIYKATESLFNNLKNPESGVTYWDWALIPILDTNGEVESLILNLLNVTKRVKANQQLIEHEKFLTTLVNSVKDAIFVVSIPDRIITNVNKAVNDLFGYDQEELVGEYTRILYPSEEAFLDYGEKVSEAIKTNQPFVRTELQMKKKDGTIIYCDVQTTFINSDGLKDTVISVIRDITDRKKIMDDLIAAKEKAEEMHRLKSNFLANMSHELRTPLIGIIGFSEFLMQDLEDEQMKELAENIYNSGNRLSETLNLILDLSKFESDKMDFKFEMVDLIKETNEIINLFSKYAEKQSLYLKSSFNSNSINILTDIRALIVLFLIIF